MGLPCLFQEISPNGSRSDTYFLDARLDQMMNSLDGCGSPHGDDVL